MTTTPGLIEDSDDAVISGELAKLRALLGKLNEQIEADRMVVHAQLLPDIVPAEKMVVAIYTPERGLVTSLNS